MKAVEMLGVCWGPATSAGVHGTVSAQHMSCITFQILDVIDQMPKVWGVFCHDEKIFIFQFVTATNVMLYGSSGYGIDNTLSHGCMFVSSKV